MGIEKKHFGNLPDGTNIDIYRLSNSNGMVADITNFGGIIVSLLVPDRNGDVADVALGYDSLEPYIDNDGYIGALIGRHANRLEDASFLLNGITYILNKNNGNNQLHGGINGFHNAVWEAQITGKNENESLVLSLRSEDGEENYPGNLDVTVSYSLTNENALIIDYSAISDKDTVANFTNHAYFNLAGHDSGDILKHMVMINANKITPANSQSLPTGEYREIKGTAMDFSTLTEVGLNIDSDYDQVVLGNGYDHNWVLDTNGMLSVKAAEVYEPQSGRVMEVFTTMPGIQFYTGNFLSDRLIGKGNVPYRKRAGLCLETQYFPNSMKHSHFPSPILKANKEYHHVTVYRFSNR